MCVTTVTFVMSGAHDSFSDVMRFGKVGIVCNSMVMGSLNTKVFVVSMMRVCIMMQVSIWVILLSIVAEGMVMQTFRIRILLIMRIVRYRAAIRSINFVVAYRLLILKEVEPVVLVEIVLLIVARLVLTKLILRRVHLNLHRLRAS